MKVFLSALENSSNGIKVVEEIKEMKWNLCSYYYLTKNHEHFMKVLNQSEEILIDSGAHSFQYGTKVKWVEYTKEYAQWIQQIDCDKIIGYFEMDVDNIIGYDKVLELRAMLEQVSDKIIPVWHKNRGIEDYKKMCRDYSGKIVAIAGFVNKDIKDDQFIMFLKYAHKYNCKLHCLGMTRKKILDEVPFDYVDSSSWVQNGIFGKARGNKVSKETYDKEARQEVMLMNYKEGIEMQEHYYKKWRHINND